MARRPTPPTPNSVAHTAEQLRRGIQKLERRLAELQNFDVASFQGHDSCPELGALQTDIQSTISDIFGAETPEYNRFAGASFFDTGPVSFDVFGRGGGTPVSEKQKHLRNSMSRNAATLSAAIKLLSERLEEHTVEKEISPTKIGLTSRKIFLVHGHDEVAKHSVARFIEQLNFVPIILHEQANQGRTIIEKIESNRDVSFAVVLLTPDDECSGHSGVTRRARQNVILELGYFIAHLGRDRVAALKKGEIEIPSDVMGVIYTELDDRGAWKMDLARELKAAGFTIDSIPF